MKTDTIYVHPAEGADTNAGAKDTPLRTLGEAARRVNQSTGAGAMTVILAEGIYALGETVLFKPEHRTFSREARLTIRAEVLPDDPAWDTGRMPTLIHTMPLSTTWNGRPDPLGGAADGMLIETSHVTIQGLKILGLPVVESPKPGNIRRLYAISRLRRDLEDLEIAQCLFTGDEATNPIHVAIIAHGKGVNVHHCVFRNLKVAVVYWTPGSAGHAMRNCLCYGLHGSAVWTWVLADDFDYRNNVVASCNYVWTASALADTDARLDGRAEQSPGAVQLKAHERGSYQVIDSYFANNRKLTGSGTGARLECKDIDSAFLAMVRTSVVDEQVILEHDQTAHNYLHPVAESAAASIGAGLFLNPPV